MISVLKSTNVVDCAYGFMYVGPTLIPEVTQVGHCLSLPFLAVVKKPGEERDFSVYSLL